MHVLAVGKWLGFPSRFMHNLGLIAPKPSVGGLEQEVMYSKRSDFSSQLISLTTCQKQTIV